MEDLSDKWLKSELEAIMKRVEAIMKRVEEAGPKTSPPQRPAAHSTPSEK